MGYRDALLGGLSVHHDLTRAQQVIGSVPGCGCRLRSKVPTVSTPTPRAGVLRGTLVGVCSALFTAAAHAAGGGAPSGTSLILLALACATIGAAISTVTIESYRAKIAALTLVVCVAQSAGHVTLMAAAHHGVHADAMPVPMVLSHLLAAAALAVLIAAAEFLHQVCGSVLCWLRLVMLHRTRAHLPVPGHRDVVVVRPVLLRSGLGMRAPPCGAPSGV
jgi:hypothetical protein